MFINNIGRAGTSGYGRQTVQAIGKNSSWTDAFQSAADSDTSDFGAAKSAAEKRRMLLRDGKDGQNMSNSRKIVENSFNYAESLRQSRTDKKKTQAKLKKLQYSYKSISSQLLRSRTSMDASKVARKARRQLITLQGKRLHESDKYNSYELEAAIAHAEAMLRVARKKVKHLQEEEQVKVKGGLCAGELEENQEQKDELAEDKIAAIEQLSLGGGDEDNTGCDTGVFYVTRNDMQQARQEWARAYEEAMRQSDMQRELQEAQARQAAESSRDMMSELTGKMTDTMKELLEQLGLSELAESQTTAEVEMDPADYKMMKLKHRLEEMKAIAKADAEYLKAVFNKLGKEKAAVAQGGLGTNNGSPAFESVSSGGMVVAANTGAPVSGHTIDVVSTPDAVAAVASVPVEGGCVDVSV